MNGNGGGGGSDGATECIYQDLSSYWLECCTLPLVQYPVSIISCWPISALIIFTKTPDINISLVTIIHSNNRGQPLGWAARMTAKKTAAVVFISCLLFIIFCWCLPASLLLGSLDPANKRDYNSAEGMTRPQQTEY